MAATKTKKPTQTDVDALIIEIDHLWVNLDHAIQRSIRAGYQFELIARQEHLAKRLQVKPAGMDRFARLRDVIRQFMSGDLIVDDQGLPRWNPDRPIAFEER